mmetsp:Transcript_1040/g.1304  ORF Transcript_1040/g.1304 Transcript_1040/m.1304 type:complete len:891 (+) Transcript_1040:42-2714(+)
MSKVSYVLPGACISDSSRLGAVSSWQCAYEKISCGLDMEFVSSRQLSNETNQYDAEIIKSCLDNTNPSFLPKIGYCKNAIDNGLCTGDYTSCQGCFEKSDMCWDDQHEGCTIQSTNFTATVNDEDNNEEESNTVGTNGHYPYALFGICTPSGVEEENGVCLWSRTECPGSYNTHSSVDTWSTPFLEKQTLCACNKVQVGACFHSNEEVTESSINNYWCAVSANSCTEGDSYIPAKKLMQLRRDATINGIVIPDCILCSKEFHIPVVETPILELTEPPAATITPTLLSTTTAALSTNSPAIDMNATILAPAASLETGVLPFVPNDHHHEHGLKPPRKEHHEVDNEVEPTKPPYYLNNGDVSSCPEIPSGGCNVCGSSKNTCITKPDAIFAFPDQPSVPCWELQQAGLSGLIPLTVCPFLSVSTNIFDACGCDTFTLIPSKGKPVVEGEADGEPEGNGERDYVDRPVVFTLPPSNEEKPREEGEDTDAFILPTIDKEKDPNEKGEDIDASTINDDLFQSPSCPEVPDGGCNICGTSVNKCVTKPNAIFAFPGQPAVGCANLQLAGLAGMVPIEDCPMLPTLINDICGCATMGSFDGQSEDDSNVTASKQLQPLQQEENDNDNTNNDELSQSSSSLSCPEVSKKGCNICGTNTGRCVTKLDAIFSFSNQPDARCDVLQKAGLSGMIPLDECSLLITSTEINTICGCSNDAEIPILNMNDENEEEFATGLLGPDIGTAIETSLTRITSLPIMTPIRVTSLPTIVPIRFTPYPTRTTQPPSMNPHKEYIPEDDDGMLQTYSSSNNKIIEDATFSNNNENNNGKTKNITATLMKQKEIMIVAAGVMLTIIGGIMIRRYRQGRNYYAQDERDYSTNGYKLNSKQTISTFEMIPMHDH